MEIYPFETEKRTIFTSLKASFDIKVLLESFMEIRIVDKIKILRKSDPKITTFEDVMSLPPK